MTSTVSVLVVSKPRFDNGIVLFVVGVYMSSVERYYLAASN